MPKIEETAPQPDLIDTTAELLGRAKPKPRRARVARPTAAVKKAAAARKPAARRSTRGRKASSSDAGGSEDGD